MRDDDPEKKQAIFREYLIASSLFHPNLPHAYEVFDNDLHGEVQLILDYCSGINLEDYLMNQNSCLSPIFSGDSLRHIASQLLEAVAYLHSKGIVHRDIKPANLILEPLTNRISLIDFNVSRNNISAFQKMMTQTGTPMFNAPEIMQGKAYTSKVDIWSIGLVLFMLMSGGQLPFTN
jgi:serine/threonine protein kinase